MTFDYNRYIRSSINQCSQSHRVRQSSVQQCEALHAPETHKEREYKIWIRADSSGYVWSFKYILGVQQMHLKKTSEEELLES